MAKIELRDYQVRIVNKSIGFLTNGSDNSVLIESPTGSGKTIMGLAIAKYFEDKYGWKTNWMAMRRNLLTQIKESNEQFFKIKGLRAVSMFDKNPPKADLIIVDEAQHDAAASAMHVHIKTKAKKVLGLSATPFRTDRLKLSFNRVIKDAGIHRLIQEGWLSKFHHFVIDEYTPTSVARTYLNDIDKWGKTIVYFHSLSQCDHFKRIVESSGIRCEIVSATTLLPRGKRSLMLLIVLSFKY